MSLPLSIIFQNSISSGNLPEMWRLANVCPIFKNGNANEVVNYRPVSLTFIVCKIMETIIKWELMDYLLSNKLISKQQQGFLSRRTTSTQLLESMNDWSTAVDSGQRINDFKSAFDTVSLIKLLNKLSSYGLSGNMWLWLSAFCQIVSSL